LDAWHSAQLGLTGKVLTLSLPQVEPNVAVPVVELFLK